MLMAEFHTACRYGLPIKVVINNNNALGQILWEQMVLGYPGARRPLRRADSRLRRVGRGGGGHGVRVAKPGRPRAGATRGARHDGPALVDVAVDPNEPPMPGKVSYEQAKKFAQAFLRGQPHKAAIATTLLKDRIQELKGDQ